MKVALLFAHALATPLVSQQIPDITPDTPVSSALLHQWLHSGDPRLIAWAADLARRNHDDAILGELPALLADWPTRPIQEFNGPTENHNKLGCQRIIFAFALN